MAGVIRRRAKAVGSKIAAGAKAVGYWAKRGTQIATGARLSARAMERVPSKNSVGANIQRSTTGSFTRTTNPYASIEVNRRGKTSTYDDQGRRVRSIAVKGKDRVVVEKEFRPGAILPRRVEKRYQKR
jgi:hypothetical protein